MICEPIFPNIVVSYRNSTSNHNVRTSIPCSIELYLIEILHQTTTYRHFRNQTASLYLIEILHQTTTAALVTVIGWSCILSKFYIKPQLLFALIEVRGRCILSKFYIKPQLRLERELARCVVSYRNSTSNHNFPIRNKSDLKLYLIEILHQTTTGKIREEIKKELYLIEILHQTTTWNTVGGIMSWLYLIEILHQTTTSGLILIDKVLLTGCLPL